MLLNSHNCSRQDSGFTLLESLIAVAILAIAVTSLLQIYSINLRSIGYSEDYLHALIRADEEIRELYLKTDLSEGNSITRTKEGMIVKWEVLKTETERTKDIPIDLFEITVTVFWQKDRRERSVMLKTYRALERV